MTKTEKLTAPLLYRQSVRNFANSFDISDEEKLRLEEGAVFAFNEGLKSGWYQAQPKEKNV